MDAVVGAGVCHGPEHPDGIWSLWVLEPCECRFPDWMPWSPHCVSLALESPLTLISETRITYTLSRAAAFTDELSLGLPKATFSLAKADGGGGFQEWWSHFLVAPLRRSSL